MHVYVLVCTQTEIRTRTVVGWYSYRTYSLSISYTLINYLSMYLYIHVHCLYSYAVLARSVVGTRSTLGRCVAAVTSMLRPSNLSATLLRALGPSGAQSMVQCKYCIEHMYSYNYVCTNRNLQLHIVLTTQYVAVL